MKRHLPTIFVIVTLIGVWWWVTSPKDGGGNLGTTAATVEWVPDGDTLHVLLADGSQERVRLIGVDGPEDSPELVECGGKDATAALEALAPKGTTVTLIDDPTQGDRDRFGRLLRYVELADGRDLGEEQIRAGRAEVRVYSDSRFRRYDDYELAEDEAVDARSGIWDACK